MRLQYTPSVSQRSGIEAFSILGLNLRSLWAVDRQTLFRRDALPGDLAVFLALAGPARRRNENHTLALKAHPAHLIAADTARI
jgi:hypothetical protein